MAKQRFPKKVGEWVFEWEGEDERHLPAIWPRLAEQVPGLTKLAAYQSADPTDYDEAGDAYATIYVLKGKDGWIVDPGNLHMVGARVFPTAKAALAFLKKVEPGGLSSARGGKPYGMPAEEAAVLRRREREGHRAAAKKRRAAHLKVKKAPQARTKRKGSAARPHFGKSAQELCAIGDKACREELRLRGRDPKTGRKLHWG